MVLATTRTDGQVRFYIPTTTTTTTTDNELLAATPDGN